MRAQVGDRHVKAMMEENGWLLGGESSGHIICSDVTTTGDGIIASLQVLMALQGTKGGVQALRAGITLYPQTMINITVSERPNLEDHPEISAAVASAERRLGKQGRVLLRPSGTEPKVRVMIEGRDHEEVALLCAELAAEVERILA